VVLSVREDFELERELGAHLVDSLDQLAAAKTLIFWLDNEQAKTGDTRKEESGYPRIYLLRPRCDAISSPCKFSSWLLCRQG
jgi:hypothetical protein